MSGLKLRDDIIIWKIKDDIKLRDDIITRSTNNVTYLVLQLISIHMEEPGYFQNVVMPLSLYRARADGDPSVIQRMLVRLYGTAQGDINLSEIRYHYMEKRKEI